MKIITSKNDALSHIEALYPIGQDSSWDKVWLSKINDFGIQNLPTQLLANIAQKMVVEQSEICEIELKDENEIPDSVIDAHITKLIQENPMRFIKYALLAIGREVHSTNADEFTFSQVSDLAPNERFKIEVKGKIESVCKP